MNRTNKSCYALKTEEGLYFALLSLIQVLVNVVVCVAVLNNRVKLMRSSVYTYVLSLLSANIALGLLNTYSTLNVAFAFEATWDQQETIRIPSSSHLRIAAAFWRGFRRSLQVCLFLVMNANISTLMYGLRHRSYFANPSSDVTSAKKSLESFNANNKRLTANVLTLLTWVIPLILTLIASTFWNCSNRCVCFGAYPPTSFSCQGDIYRICSRVFEPMRNDFLLLLIALWFVLDVVNGGMIFSTFKAYKVSTSAENTFATGIVKDNRDASENRSNTDIPQYSVTCKPHETSTSLAMHKVTEKDDISHHSTNTKLHEKKLNVMIKAMLFLSVLFVLSTLPYMILVGADCVSTIYPITRYHVGVANSTLFLYCIASPLILLYHLPGLREAVAQLSFCCRCCTRTTITRGINQSKSRV